MSKTTITPETEGARTDGQFIHTALAEHIENGLCAIGHDRAQVCGNIDLWNLGRPPEGLTGFVAHGTIRGFLEDMEKKSP
jgi:hypothetical protein